MQAETERARNRLRRIARCGALALGLAVWGAATPQSAEPAALYQWTDAQGVIRYTPDPARIPGDRRSTMVRVDPSTPGMEPPATALPEPDLGLQRDDDVVTGPAPFNAPQRAGRVETVDVGATPSRETTASRALEARRLELQDAIDADEEALKALISGEPADGSDTLIDSEELREIARRLPELQRELDAIDAKRRRHEQR